MPELPEIEIICRGVHKGLIASGEKPIIRKVKLYRRDLRVPFPKNFSRKIIGEHILQIRRRAKYLLFDTETTTIISHLGMSGSWRLTAAYVHGNKIKRKKHDHCEVYFSDGSKLIYHDPRRFGLIDCVPRNQEQQSRWLKHLGVEPLTKDFTANYLQKKASSRPSINIKSFIMNQTVVVGVGNIYASEALFAARIHPLSKVNSISKEQWVELVRSIKKVLARAIRYGGTTLRDYRQATGETGSYQKKLYVYARAGEKCHSCNMTIMSQMVAGRSTFWCSACQK
ncbi:MAG: DNA-formamidopyrimidine glycosylase [Bdellovibrionales bacterium RBG_16_40_8]|nr:MAG: DNA-formamidopyrimidine glycosylase [Bdellovibrionales bacterium RBG_16_40_8]